MAKDEMQIEEPQVIENDHTLIIVDDDGGGSSTSGGGTSVHPVIPSSGGGEAPSAFSYNDAELTTADLTMALTGRTLLAGETKEGGGTVGLVLNFRKTSGSGPLPYVGELVGVMIYFTEKGRSQDGSLQLALANATIGNTGSRGEAQTRSDDDATFVMNSLNYREQVALRVLQAIIKHEPNPLGYDDPKIMYLVAMAFRIAVEFQNRAIEFRKEESGEGGDTGVDVDEDSLADNTEKLLYNLVDVLKEGIAVQGKSGDKVTPLLININKKVTEKKTDNITIYVAIFEQKYIRFRFNTNMAYSDISVYITCNVKEDTTTDVRKVGFVLPRGTVAVVKELDDKVTEITEITSKVIRGQDIGDENTYVLETETI